MDYEFKILEERMKSLPADMQAVMVSPEISEKVEEVAKKYSLDIEQTGILMDITSYVMLALIPSKDFVTTLAKEAQIDTTKSAQIASDINNQVFASIRESLRKVQDAAENNTADINKAGDLTVEKDVADQPSHDTMNKAHILNSIETAGQYASLPINVLTPVTVAPATTTPAENPNDLPMVVPIIATAPAPSPLVSRLMTTPTASSNEKIEKKITPIQPIQSSRPGGDPYREPIE